MSPLLELLGTPAGAVVLAGSAWAIAGFRLRRAPRQVRVRSLRSRHRR